MFVYLCIVDYMQTRQLPLNESTDKVFIQLFNRFFVNMTSVACVFLCLKSLANGVAALFVKKREMIF